MPTDFTTSAAWVKQPACAASTPARGTDCWLLRGLLAVGLGLSSVARADLALSVDSIVEVIDPESLGFLFPQVGSTGAAILCGCNRNDR